MEKVGFIGGSDKTDIIMYVAKVLQYMNKKVLVIDTTLTQKTRYVVPSVNPTKAYVTEFEKIDFAVGFNSITDLVRYLGIKEVDGEKKLPYDYILIDIDNAKTLEEFELAENEKKYFVTSFDSYSLKRGMEILENLGKTIKLTKVINSISVEKADEEYFDYLTIGCKVVWNEFTVYIPQIYEDVQLIEENQRIQRLKLKKLSLEYQGGVIAIVQDILKERNLNKIRKSIKE